MNDELILQRREMMKGHTRADAAEDYTTDQQAGLPQPPLSAERGGQRRVKLTRQFDGLVKNDRFSVLLEERKSRRDFDRAPLTLPQLSYLLWACQGVKLVGKSKKATIRTVPSAGARHALETYVFVNRVEGLEPGLYHYLAPEHTLEALDDRADMADRLCEALCGQTFAAYAPVCFVWAAAPYRMEWRYERQAQKYILLDAGHAAQNLYLACEAMALGTCAIGAYQQEELDALLGLSSAPSADHDAQFAVYAAAAGRPRV